MKSIVPFAPHAFYAAPYCKPLKLILKRRSYKPLIHELQEIGRLWPARLFSPPLPTGAGGWAPALPICWDPTLASPILFTNALRCFNIISFGTRCYLSFLAPLRRHLPMFSRHDINSPKEACSLTDSPYWNLTDNDFVFAEPGALLGVGEKCVVGLCIKKTKKKRPP